MGPKNNASFQSSNYFHRLSKALEFAVSEWLLMFLLFIDACFTYLIAKFASCCQLQGPCLLCSRHDHILAKDKTGIYWDSICTHHKSEISSVVLCHIHDKLINVHGICENCVLTLARQTKNKFNDETFRLLVEKMGSSPLLGNCNRDLSGSRVCFCCNEEYDSRDYSKNLLPDSSMHSDVSKSLFANGEHSKIEKNIFVDKPLESFRSLDIKENQIVPSSEVEYQKENASSESDPELPVSDNRSAPALIPEVQLKPVSQFEAPDPHHDPATVAASDMEELKWQDDANKEDISHMTRQISSDEAPPTNIVDTSANALSNLVDTSANVLLETMDSPTTEEPKDPVIESEPSATMNSHQMLTHLDLGDAYKLAISTNGRQLSGKLLDQKSFKDSSTRVTEDLKILLSHRSNDSLISPKFSFNSDELTGMQFLQRRISLERNESNISLDGSVVSEVEGESAVDRLRRQVEHDKKLMGALYKELEEERNASAVATNQAMAMITRLQEEKAALYTEALQCLRVMEEQAEYNSEALQKANDLIEEKDKQIQELEEILRTTSEDVKE